MSTAPAFQTSDTLKPLLFDPAKLTGLSERLIRSHWLGGSGKAGAPERQAIAQAFGSFDTWETEFHRIGAGLGGGSGWVVLGFNLHLRQLENYWLADHAHGPAAAVPVLVMDMYEHSYQMDYGAAAAK